MTLLSLIRSSGFLTSCSKCNRLRRLQDQSRFYHRSKHYNNRWKEEAVHVKIPLGESYMKVSSGNLARFADGSASVQLGNTTVMVTTVSKGSNDRQDFLPLTVDYRQKAAAAGRIPTNHMRREMGASETEILTSRMIDRSLRPLFPAGYLTETQVVCNLIAVDGVNDPAVVSINAASAALALSDIPWNGPIGAVRVGLIGSQVAINPTRKQLASSSLNLVIAAMADNKIVMLEASGERVASDDFCAALTAGVQESQNIISHLTDMARNHGREKRAFDTPEALSTDLTELVADLSSQRLKVILTDSSLHKFSRDNAVQAVKADVVNEMLRRSPELVEERGQIAQAFDKSYKALFRRLILDTQTRCDGRGLRDLRPISCQANMYPPLHGSALFQRGQTQVLCTLTFDSPDSAAKVDTVSAIMSGMKEKNFFLHYEFPPYATNETGRAGGFGRREIGHGALAEKGLRAVVPSNNPFAIRLSAEVLESNGSSSMAAICAGSLALMDAGVPISEAAAGVAIGLITDTDPVTNEMGRYQLLTDLLGIEDYLGDMDFKISGTRSGITALQADIKLSGLPLDIALEAVNRGTDGIHRVLDIMSGTLSSPREEAKENRPVVETLEVMPAKRAALIGIGGYNLKKILAETGVTVSQKDEQSFSVFAPNQLAMDEAQEIIKQLLADNKEPVLDFGGIYQATVVEMRDFGVMVQLFKDQSPVLIHNSQLDHRKISHPSVLKLAVGQEISVKYFGRDPATGKMRLSRKVLQGRTAAIKNLLASSS